MTTSPPENAAPDGNDPPNETPKGLLGTVLKTLPVALTVLATAFAGLSSSEMTQAMFHRSIAGQNQSKAGDQWAFFQAKRIRGTNLETTAELIQTLTETQPFDPAKISTLLSDLTTALEKQDAKKEKSITAPEKVQAAAAEINQLRDKWNKLLQGSKTELSLLLEPKQLQTLLGQTDPKAEAKKEIAEAIEQIRRHKSEQETVSLIRKIRPDDIEEAIRTSEQQADAFDQACQPMATMIERLRDLIMQIRQAAGSALGGNASDINASLILQEKGFKIAVLQFDARRYRQEAHLNRATAELYEVRVRRSGAESDRHRERSLMFFYSMLLAQGGVTLASLALARQERNSLWLVAALAGMISLAFTGYIYLTF